MTVLRRTAAPRPPMDPARRTALAAGVLYLVTFLSSIPAVALLGPVLDPAYIVSAGADTRVLLGNLLDLVNAVACIGTAVVLFPVVRRQHQAAALGFVTARVMEAAIIVIGVVSLLAVVTLRDPGATGAEAAALVTTGRSLVAVRDWTFLLGPGVVPGVNALLLGSLLYRSGLVPRVIPALGLLGAPLLIGTKIAVILGVTELTSTWPVVATAPIFVWELALGLWLTVKGFTPTAAVLRQPASRVEPAAPAIP